jgi:hypothetical protein
MAEAVPSVVELMVKRIRYPVCVKIVDDACWNVLMQLAAAKDADEAVRMVPITLLLEAPRRQKDPGMVYAIFRAITAGLHRKEDERPTLTLSDEQQHLLLVRSMESMIECLHAIETRVREEMQFDAIDESRKDVASSVLRMNPLIDCFETLLRDFPTISVPFFGTEVEPRLTEWLELPGWRFFAICLFAVYFKVTGDFQRLATLRPFIDQVIENPEEVDMKEHVFGLLVDVFAVHQVDQETACVYYDFFIAAFESDAELSEKHALAWDGAVIAFSAFLRMNIQYFDPEEVAGQWHEYMPIWVREDESEPAAALLADFLEARNQFFLDPFPLSEALVRLFKNNMWANAQNETKTRLMLALRQLAQDPSLLPAFQDAFEALTGEHQRQFRAMVQGRML